MLLNAFLRRKKMYDKRQFSDIITRTLKGIGRYSPQARNILLGTAAQESDFGKYLRQLNSGPALGAFQMEPATFVDIRNNYLAYRPLLLSKILFTCGVIRLNSKMLEYNLKVAICFARLQYLRYPEPLPDSIDEMAWLWKKRYNTYKGKGTTIEFVKNYRKYVL